MISHTTETMMATSTIIDSAFIDYTLLVVVDTTTAFNVSLPSTAKEILVILKNTNDVIFGSVTVPKALFSNNISLKNPADTSKEVYKSGNKWKVTDATNYRGVIYYR